MLLYHGTTEAAALRIRVEGIKPRSVTQASNWDHTIPSNPRLVYLTECYAPYFALCSLPDEERCDPTAAPTRAAIIEVSTSSLDLGRMLPDEDFLEQAIRSREEDQARLGLRGLSMEERTTWFRDNIWQFQALWMDSIKHLGNAAYGGTIPPEAITRAWAWDTAASPITHMAMDPSITILNHLICANKYKAMTRALLGEEIEPTDLMTLGMPPEVGDPRFDEAVARQAERLREGVETLQREGLERLF